MRLIVRDSHRDLTKYDKASLADFFAEVKNMTKDEAYSQVLFCSDYFEHEFAVSWFEVIVYSGFKAAGYLRCLRFPDDASKWYIGDVNVRKAFRRKGIASLMYKTVFDELDRYCDAKCVCSSVSGENVPSIFLHKKFGFEDTGLPCTFKSFYFDPKESEYDKVLYKHYPVPEGDKTLDILWPVFSEYLMDAKKNVSEQEGRDMLNSLIADSLLGKDTLYAIWCGNDLSGLKFSLNGETTEYIRTKNR